MEKIRIHTTDDRYTVRETLERIDSARVLMVLPWDVDKGWLSPLDYEIQQRVARRRGFEMAWVVEDPARRAVARDVGFRVYGSEAAAERHLSQRGEFPDVKRPAEPERPKQPWWAPIPSRPKPPAQERPATWLLALEGIVLLIVLVIVGIAFVFAVPSAEIVVYPASTTYSRIVPISVDPTLEQVDLERGIIPASRIGEEFEGYAEVVTSGRGVSFEGRATGRILFSNLLGQNYEVPRGTVVRTSASSYPVRYETTAAVTIPAFGQAEAPVEALIEGPRGNVNAYQINLIEGPVGFAVRVTNPAPITGAESKTVRVVSEEDRERAWNIAAEQVLAQAYDGLQALAGEQPGRFLPQQTLFVQAAPRASYTHLVGERADTLGLSLRLLVTGEAVDAVDVQAVAYRQLVRQLPEGYTLTDVRFEYGEAAEEDIGPGQFTFFVKAHGYATAKIDPSDVEALAQGMPVAEARTTLADTLPLSAPPEINVTPAWFPYIPFVPVRLRAEVVAGSMPGSTTAP